MVLDVKHIRPQMISPAESSPDRQRFLLDLEFLNALASPSYLNWLAQNRYFDDAAFVNYLQYLLYWRRPEYARFVIYPHSLHFLELLQSKEFRTALALKSVQEHIEGQQFCFWSSYKRNRVMTGTADSGQAAVMPPQIS